MYWVPNTQCSSSDIKSFIKEFWRSLGRIFSNLHITNVLLLVVTKAPQSALDNFIHTKKYTDTVHWRLHSLAFPVVGRASVSCTDDNLTCRIEEMHFKKTPVSFKILFRFIYLWCMCVCMCGHTCQCACGYKRTNLGIQFSPIIWVSGIKVRVSTLAASTFTCSAILPGPQITIIS